MSFYNFVLALPTWPNGSMTEWWGSFDFMILTCRGSRVNLWARLSLSGSRQFHATNQHFWCDSTVCNTQNVKWIANAPQAARLLPDPVATCLNLHQGRNLILINIPKRPNRPQTKMGTRKCRVKSRQSVWCSPHHLWSADYSDKHNTSTICPTCTLKTTSADKFWERWRKDVCIMCSVTVSLSPI